MYLGFFATLKNAVIMLWNSFMIANYLTKGILFKHVPTSLNGTVNLWGGNKVVAWAQ